MSIEKYSFNNKSLFRFYSELIQKTNVTFVPKIQSWKRKGLFNILFLKSKPLDNEKFQNKTLVTIFINYFFKTFTLK